MFGLTVANLYSFAATNCEIPKTNQGANNIYTEVRESWKKINTHTQHVAGRARFEFYLFARIITHTRWPSRTQFQMQLQTRRAHVYAYRFPLASHQARQRHDIPVPISFFSLFSLMFWDFILIYSHDVISWRWKSVHISFCTVRWNVSIARTHRVSNNNFSHCLNAFAESQ